MLTVFRNYRKEVSAPTKVGLLQESTKQKKVSTALSKGRLKVLRPHGTGGRN